MKFDGLRKPPAFRLMLRILLFFGDTVGDGVLPEAQHAVEMSCEHARDLLPRVPGGIVTAQPYHCEKKACNRGTLSIGPQRAECFFDGPCPTDLEPDRP